MSAPVPVVTAELRSILSRLKLGQMMDTLPERLLSARQSSMNHVDFLEMVLSDEVARRDSRSAQLRANSALLDPVPTNLDCYHRNTTRSKLSLMQLTKLGRVEKLKGFLGPGNITIGGIQFTTERKTMKAFKSLIVSLGLALSSVTVGIVSTAGASTGSTVVIASYGGGTLDLSQSWGTAMVCVVAVGGNQCYSTQSAYKIATSQTVQSASGLCSTGLALFANVNYGGRELILQTTSVWINLSTYSFSNTTSSFQVSACGVSMTDAANGSGSTYPGPTSAGSNVAWIGATWNDRIASVLVL